MSSPVPHDTTGDSDSNSSESMSVQSYMHLLYPNIEVADSDVDQNTAGIKIEDYNPEPCVENVTDDDIGSYSVLDNYVPSTSQETDVPTDENQLSAGYYVQSDNGSEVALPQEVTITDHAFDDVKQRLKSKLLTKSAEDTMAPSAIAAEDTMTPLLKSAKNTTAPLILVRNKFHGLPVTNKVIHKLKAKLVAKDSEDVIIENTEEPPAPEDVDDAVPHRLELLQAVDAMTENIKIQLNDSAQEDDSYVCLPVTSPDNTCTVTDTGDSTDTLERKFVKREHAVFLEDTKSMQNPLDVVHDKHDKESDYNSCTDTLNEHKETVLANSSVTARRCRKSKHPGRWGQKSNTQRKGDSEVEFIIESVNDMDTRETCSDDEKTDISSIKSSDIPAKYKKAKNALGSIRWKLQSLKTTPQTRSSWKGKPRKKKSINSVKVPDVGKVQMEGKSGGNIQQEKAQHRAVKGYRVARKYLIRRCSSTTRKNRKIKSERDTVIKRNAKPNNKKIHSWCEQCGDVFTNIQDAYKHQKQHPQVRHRYPKMGQDGFGGSCLCHLCGIIYNNSSALYHHMKTIHIKDKTYKCTVVGCEKVFTHHSGWRTHILRIHSAVRKHECELCGQTFKMKYHLKCHVARIHKWDPDDPANLYRCHVCNKALKTKYLLDNHVKVHTQQRDYTCPYGNCGKTFTCKYYLKRHEKIHTGDKPYNCDVCGQTFTRRAYLDDHHWKHTGTKPFHCMSCDRGFVQKGSLDVHVRTVHGNVRDDTDKDRSTCDDCGRIFSNKSNMLAHRKRKHEVSPKKKKMNGMGTSRKMKKMKMDIGPEIATQSAKLETTSLVDTPTQTSSTDLSNLAD